MNIVLSKQYDAGAAIAAYTLVKMGAADGAVIAAAAATDAIVGATMEVAPASGERVDIIQAGIAEVKLAGTVTRGAWITSDGSGNGVATTTTGNQVIGRALTAGVSGDIIPVLIAPCQL